MTKIVFALIFALITSVSFSSPVLAAQKKPSKDTYADLGGFSLTPTVGGLSYAGTGSRTISPLYGVKIGYDIIGTSIVNSLGIEGTLNYFTANPQNGGSTANGYLFRIDALYPFLILENHCSVSD